MTDFSRDPGEVLADNLAQGYAGLHFQQGVPILDRDLNLLQDLVAATVRSVLTRYLGSGVPALSGADGVPRRSDAFTVTAVSAGGKDNDFVVKAGAAPPGRCLVNGIEVTIDADRNYSDQSLPALQAPASGSGSRTDVVFLDVFLSTVESGTVMENPDDVVVQTSVRLKPAWLARVAAVGSVPAPEPGHGHLTLAQIVRKPGQDHITPDAITDMRTHCFALPDLRRMLLDPIIFTSPTGGHPGDPVTITGRNFQFFKDDKVSVLFGANSVTVDPAKTTPTSLGLTVPPFNPPITSATPMLLTVRTAYGSSTQAPFQALPPNP